MSNYQVVTSTERDTNGRITRTGATWGETRPNVEQLIMILGAFGILGTLFGLCWAVLAKAPNPLLFVGIAAMGGALWMTVKLPGRPRAVYLHDDGLIETPHGIVHLPSIEAIGGTHEAIVSIEARPQQYQPRVEGTEWPRLYEVIIISQYGDLVLVSRNLRENIALKAAAQLSQSLASLRKESPEAMGLVVGDPVH